MRLVEILQKINTFIYLSCQKMFIGRCRNYLVEQLQMYQKIKFSAVIQRKIQRKIVTVIVSWISSTDKINLTIQFRRQK